MPVNKAQALQYKKWLDDQAKAAWNLKDDVYQAMVQSGEILRTNVLGQLQAFGGANDRLTPQQMRQLRQITAREIENFRRRSTIILDQGIGDIARLGSMGGDPAMPVLGLLSTPGVGTSPELTALSIAYSADLIDDISRQTQLKINSALTKGLLGEKAPYEIIDEVDKILITKGEKTYLNRANSIVRTEMGRAHGLMQQANFNEIGTDLDPELQPYLDKRWISNLGQPNPRPWHAELHGMTIPYDQDFDVGGEQLAYPRDPRGSAWNTINCNCDVVIDTDRLMAKMEEDEKASIAPGIGEQ